MKPLKTKVSITLDTNIIEILKELAEADDRSFSQYINLILKEYLAKKKDNEQHKKKQDSPFQVFPAFLIFVNFLSFLINWA